MTFRLSDADGETELCAKHAGAPELHRGQRNRLGRGLAQLATLVE